MKTELTIVDVRDALATMREYLECAEHNLNEVARSVGVAGVDTPAEYTLKCALAEVASRGSEGSLHPCDEALGWILAEKLGLIDGIGGAEWNRRVEGGSVTPEAAQLILMRGGGRS